MLLVALFDADNMNIFSKFFMHNWVAIFYFNFRMLPFMQAIRLPFDFYHKVRFEKLSGKVKLNADRITMGMIKVGGRGSEMFTRGTTIIDLGGHVIFNGVLELGHGCLLRIEHGAVATFGHEVRLGAYTKVFCCESITFADEIDFSWECQIFDTNFHYIRDVETSEIETLTAPVNIGSCNWFGNRVTVMRGTKTPDYFICASNSLCNRDYSGFPRHSVVGGYPAKLVATNKQRVFENLENVAGLELLMSIGAAK